MLLKVEVKVDKQTQKLLKKFFSLSKEPDETKIEVPIGNTFIIAYNFGTEDLERSLERLKILGKILKASKRSEFNKKALENIQKILYGIDSTLKEISKSVTNIE